MWIHNNTNIHKSVSVVARKPPMSYLRVVIRQDVKSHNLEREKRNSSNFVLRHADAMQQVGVCLLTYRLNPDSAQTSGTTGRCHSSESWVCKCLRWTDNKNMHKRWRDRLTTDATLTFKKRKLWWNTIHSLVSPAARMNWPSLDTLIELHTVGISKSWMSSILRWMSGGKNERINRKVRTLTYTSKTTNQCQLTNIFLL